MNASPRQSPLKGPGAAYREIFKMQGFNTPPFFAAAPAPDLNIVKPADILLACPVGALFLFPEGVLRFFDRSLGTVAE